MILSKFSAFLCPLIPDTPISESSLCAQWVAKDPLFLHADSEDPDQTQADVSLRWAHTHRCFCHEAHIWMNKTLCINWDLIHSHRYLYYRESSFYSNTKLIENLPMMLLSLMLLLSSNITDK